MLTMAKRVQAGGSIVGAGCAGLISDRIGRRDSIAFGELSISFHPHRTSDDWTACIFWLIGTAVQVSTQSRAQLIVSTGDRRKSSPEDFS